MPQNMNMNLIDPMPFNVTEMIHTGVNVININGL